MSVAPEPSSTFIADVHIRKVETGEVRVYESKQYVWDEEEGWDYYLWSEGNYECDCNREVFFEYAGNEEKENSDSPPCSSGRYVIDKIVKRDTGDVIYSEKER
jgi:hypothetical protein